MVQKHAHYIGTVHVMHWSLSDLHSSLVAPRERPACGPVSPPSPLASGIMQATWSPPPPHPLQTLAELISLKVGSYDLKFLPLTPFLPFFPFFLSPFPLCFLYSLVAFFSLSLFSHCSLWNFLTFCMWVVMISPNFLLYFFCSLLFFYMLTCFYIFLYKQ